MLRDQPSVEVIFAFFIDCAGDQEIMKTEDSLLQSNWRSQDGALYWYFLLRRACSNAEWGPVNRLEIISHIDSRFSPLLTRTMRESVSSTVKWGTGLLLFWQFHSFILLIGCREFANTLNCVDKRFTAPALLIWQSRQSLGLLVINTRDNGDMWPQRWSETKCLHSHALHV